MIERVLLAVDCFEHSGNALDFMVRLQGSIGDVIVLTVVDNAFTLSRSGLRFDSDGTPIEVIPEQMALFNCDLLIISHRHLSSLGRWLNASVTRGLLDEIGQPVLVIPR